MIKTIEDETHLIMVKDGITITYDKEPGNISRGIIRDALDIIGYREAKETIEKLHYKKDIPVLLKMLDEEFINNNIELIEAETLKNCGEPKMIEKPATDYSAAFDVNSQVDSTMQIIKGCKNDPKNNDPNKLVPYGNADAKLYWGCGTQLGYYLLRNFDEACAWAKKYPAQIDQPFITDKGGIISKGHFLYSAMYSYGYYSRTNPKLYKECLDLALQNTGNVDMITASHADGVNPAIFRLITAPGLNQPEIMEKFFAKGINVNLPSCDKYTCKTALGYAVQNGNEQLVKMLLEHGANPNIGVYDRNTHKHTPPVQTAFDGKKYKLLKMLLEHNADLREGATLNGKVVKSNEDYYQAIEAAYKGKNVDDESYRFFQEKFNYFKAPYTQEYSFCKSSVINDLHSTQGTWFTTEQYNDHVEL